MQAVVSAGFVVQQQRRGLDLPGLVTNPQKRLMLRGKTWALVSEKVGPLVGYFGEMRINAGSERRDDFRQRIAKVFVISDPETVALHHDLAAEPACLGVHCHEREAFLSQKNRRRYRITALGQGVPRRFPVERGDAFLDGLSRQCFSS